MDTREVSKAGRVKSEEREEKGRRTFYAAGKTMGAEGENGNTSFVKNIFSALNRLARWQYV